MSRPQVGIERLPAAANRRMSNEPRESMNCKSCRKRKIKCNRLRPTCEACQVFQCPCIYDAVPKKRGPKTDVLEALLKRVDGLEKRLKDEKKSTSRSPPDDGDPTIPEEAENGEVRPPKRPHLDTDVQTSTEESALFSPVSASIPSPTVLPDAMVDTFFARVHGKPYTILDETTIRQRLVLNQVPYHLQCAIYAVSTRYAAHPNGHHASVRLSEEYATRARAEVDLDDPSIECIQTLLLLTSAFIAAGKGKKAYMMLTNAIGMALALELHREIDINTRVTPLEREMRRQLFWTCYVMDRLVACGSKRPSLIVDKSILLRLPSRPSHPGTLYTEGEFFQNGSNLQYISGSGKRGQASSSMLIDIARILNVTNRYLAAGGVKGDSHFPWHSLSNLSKIRHDLDIWASGTQEVFSSVDGLFGQSDSTTLVLSKLIYHLIHCLIYRPFLPIDLAELAGTGQHQSWQIEATNLCFLHANAIAELVELGKQSAVIEWPAFVGYCICTAGTVHVHGAHYRSGREEEVFTSSAEFLSREMQQISDLRYAWSSVQHQRETLQTIYGCHSELVKSVASNPARYSPVFQLEDFFDRYTSLGQQFDGAHLSFRDTTMDSSEDTYTGHELYAANDTAALAAKRRISLNARHLSSGHIPHYNGHLTDQTMPKSLLHQAEPMNDPQPANHMAFPHDLHHPLQASQHPPPHAQAPTQHTPNLSDCTSLTPFAMPSIPNLSHTPFSPPYMFSTPTPHPPDAYDSMYGMSQPYPTAGQGYGYEMMGSLNGGGVGGGGGPHQAMTPGGRSNGESTGTAGEEKDPFLSLLEQLAENEHSRGGPSELDFFLTGQGG